MDNRVFDVNGSSIEQFRLAIHLAFLQCGTNTKAVLWKSTPKNGLILFEYSSDSEKAIKLPVPLSAGSAATLAWDWLQSDSAKEFIFPTSGWFSDCDHDGSNSIGWRVYCENWGKVNGAYGTICAIHPAYLWYGK